MKQFLGILFIIISCRAGAQSPARTLTIGDSLYATGNYTNAIKQYEAIENANAGILLKTARAYSGKGVKSTALKLYKKSLELDNDQPIAQTEYGRLLLSRSKFTQADTVFRDLATRFPDNPEYVYQLGRVLKRKKGKDTISYNETEGVYKIQLPEDAFSKAIALDSTHQKAMYELAKIYLGKKDYPVVEKITKKALESDPENVEMISILAQNYYYKGWWTEAIEWLTKLIDRGQSTAFIHNNLGRAYAHKSMTPEAIEQYEVLLTYDDEDWAVLLTLAKLYSFNQDLDKAIAYGKKALYFKDLSLDDVHFTLGRAYEIKKDFKTALVHYRKAIKEDPSNLRANYGIAVVADNYYEDREEVLQIYERFVEKFGKGEHSSYFVLIAQDRIEMLKQDIFEARG